MWDGNEVAFTPDGRNIYVSQSSYFGLVALGRDVGIAPRATWRPSARILTVKLACPAARTEGCRGTFRVRRTNYRPARVGVARFSVLPGRTANIELRVSRHAHLGHRKPRPWVTATDADRLVRPARGTVRLRVRRR
jgi:hypothetical protein